MTQILVVKPKTLNAADKAALRKIDIVVVEARNPADVRMLQPEGPALNSNDLLYAAMQAIASDRWADNTRVHFANTVAALVKAARPQGGTK